MDGKPAWGDRLTDLLHESWQSPGGINLWARETRKKWVVLVTPALREICGGAEDGRELYAHFTIDIHKLRPLFDKTPRVRYDSGREKLPPFLLIQGRIDGVLVEITVLAEPMPGTPPQEVIYMDGPKKGTVERRDDNDE